MRGKQEEEEEVKEEGKGMKIKYRLRESWDTCSFQVNQNKDKKYSHSAVDWQIRLWK